MLAVLAEGEERQRIQDALNPDHVLGNHLPQIFFFPGTRDRHHVAGTGYAIDFSHPSMPKIFCEAS